MAGENLCGSQKIIRKSKHNKNNSKKKKARTKENKQGYQQTF